GNGCTNCTELNAFSSPNNTYEGRPTGTANQDNVRTINNTRDTIANYRAAATGATLSPPTGLTASSSGSNVTLNWSAPSSGTPTAYIIEAGSTPGATNLANADLGSAATSATFNGVGRGTYYVRLRARNTCGASGPSNEVLLIVP